MSEIELTRPSPKTKSSTKVLFTPDTSISTIMPLKGSNTLTITPISNERAIEILKGQEIKLTESNFLPLSNYLTQKLLNGQKSYYLYPLPRG